VIYVSSDLAAVTHFRGENQSTIEQVLQQNRDALISKGTAGIYPIYGVVDGVKYRVGLIRGRVGQFYPVKE
jgi:hypothetical protein